jgi:predicted nucleic acid-binding protein
MTPLHEAEWTHALEQHVFRGAISRGEADRFYQRFTGHRVEGLWREAAIPDKAFEVCAELAKKYAARIGVRTLDSLHVACALELRADRFWTFDLRQQELAQAVGLNIA